LSRQQGLFQARNITFSRRTKLSIYNIHVRPTNEAGLPKVNFVLWCDCLCEF